MRAHNLPRGATPLHGYSCAACGAPIPDEQPEEYRGYCDTACKRLDELAEELTPAERDSVLKVDDATVNEAASRERMAELDLADILPERIRRTLYEAGFNVETTSVAPDSSTCELRVRSDDGQTAIVTIAWEA